MELWRNHFKVLLQSVELPESFVYMPTAWLHSMQPIYFVHCAIKKWWIRRANTPYYVPWLSTNLKEKLIWSRPGHICLSKFSPNNLIISRIGLRIISRIYLWSRLDSNLWSRWFDWLLYYYRKYVWKFSPPKNIFLNPEHLCTVYQYFLNCLTNA